MVSFCYDLPRRSSILAPILSLAVALTGCKTRADSSAKHAIGEITRRTKAFTCTPKQPDPKLASFHGYIKDHVQRISGTGSAVIPPEFSGDKFCLVVEDSPEVNAFALDDGTIIVTVGLLKATENDAQFASVIAHEMAHVLQGHGSERIPDEMSKNPEYRQIFELMVQHRRELKKLDKEDEARRDQESSKSAKTSAEMKSKLGYYIELVSAYAAALMENPYEFKTQNFYKDIVESGLPKELVGSSDNFTKRERWPAATLRGMAQDSRQKTVSSLTGADKQDFLKSEKGFLDSLSKYVLHGMKYAEADRRAKLIMALDTGIARASNWREQEADEVGFELYLRSGYDHREYVKMLENMLAATQGPRAGGAPSQGTSTKAQAQPGPSSSVQSLADEIEGKGCSRGSATHPEPCWRMADIENEWKRHKEFYALIAAKQPVIQVFGDRLKTLRKTHVEGSAASTGTNSRPVTDSRTGSPQAPGGTAVTRTWCDPFSPANCYAYCKSYTSDPDLTGWGSEGGKTCVIEGGPVDRRQ